MSDSKPMSARALLEKCETVEQMLDVIARVENAANEFARERQAFAARGNESLTLPVLMARLQRKAGARQVPRLVRP